jgi:hypothetical protein
VPLPTAGRRHRVMCLPLSRPPAYVEEEKGERLKKMLDNFFWGWYRIKKSNFFREFFCKNN